MGSVELRCAPSILARVHRRAVRRHRRYPRHADSGHRRPAFGTTLYAAAPVRQQQHRQYGRQYRRHGSSQSGRQPGRYESDAGRMVRSARVRDSGSLYVRHGWPQQLAWTGLCVLRRRRREARRPRSGRSDDHRRAGVQRVQSGQLRPARTFCRRAVDLRPHPVCEGAARRAVDGAFSFLMLKRTAPMSRLRTFGLAVALTLAVVGPHAQAPAARALLVIVVDGLRPDYVTPQLMPRLVALGRRGIVFNAHHAVFPAVTRVNASTMVTGVYPEAHGLLGNTIFIPSVNATRGLDTGSYENLEAVARAEGRLLTAPTLGEMLAQSGKKLVGIGSGTSGA